MSSDAFTAVQKSNYIRNKFKKKEEERDRRMRLIHWQGRWFLFSTNVNNDARFRMFFLKQCAEIWHVSQLRLVGAGFQLKLKFNEAQKRGILWRAPFIRYHSISMMFAVALNALFEQLKENRAKA